MPRIPPERGGGRYPKRRLQFGEIIAIVVITGIFIAVSGGTSIYEASKAGLL